MKSPQSKKMQYSNTLVYDITVLINIMQLNMLHNIILVFEMYFSLLFFLRLFWVGLFYVIVDLYYTVLYLCYSIEQKNVWFVQ